MFISIGVMAVYDRPRLFCSGDKLTNSALVRHAWVRFVGGLDLDLGGSKVNEVGVEWFAKGNKTARLRLFNSGMGDAGVCCLARQLHMVGVSR